MLECSVLVDDNMAPNFSFSRFVFGNLYMGFLDRNVRHNRHHHTYLCVVTAKNTFKYKLFENIKRVNSMQIRTGKMGIEFGHPWHNVLIKCDAGKLASFFRRLQTLCDEKKIHSLKLSSIPIIPSPLKFVSVPKSQEPKPHVKDIICQIPCPLIRKEALKNAQILHLPNSNLHDIPVQLGLINWSEINLENNNLKNEDLLWLEELPIRRTLVKLNLSKNKLTSFPSALVDFRCLNFVNLRENEISDIPGAIGSLQCLRDLNLSNNQIRYLPASMVDLRLNKLDLTNNYLTGHLLDNITCKRTGLGSLIRLEDLASVKIDSSYRRQLSPKECPRQLLEKLRCTSQCVCGRKTVPLALTECYAPLMSLRFSASFSVQPQKSNQGSGILLQYHLCLNLSECDNKKYLRTCIIRPVT